MPKLVIGRPVVPEWSYYMCIDMGLDAHDWYRAPGLDIGGEGWVLSVARALPPEIMYVGRVDTKGRHQWLEPAGPHAWVWNEYIGDVMPVLRRPRKP
jgi:hypothetical protein